MATFVESAMARIYFLDQMPCGKDLGNGVPGATSQSREEQLTNLSSRARLLLFWLLLSRKDDPNSSKNLGTMAAQNCRTHQRKESRSWPLL